MHLVDFSVKSSTSIQEIHILINLGCLATKNSDNSEICLLFIREQQRLFTHIVDRGVARIFRGRGT